jgi:hypothetical protein
MTDGFIEKQTLKLAAIYKETVALRFIANINAIFNGLLIFYLLMIGVGGMVLVAVFCLFVINAVFFFSSRYKDGLKEEKTL